MRAQRFADLLTRGWVRLAGHLDTDECAALAKPQTPPWTQMAPKVGAVTQHGWFAQLPFHEAPPPVQAFGSEMRATVSAAIGQQLPDWTDATWQRYESGYGHIGPHRDQAFYKGVILIVTLAGEAEFTVLESRDPPLTLDRWITAAGDMVLLRGADLGVCGARCPLHKVGTPTSQAHIDAAPQRARIRPLADPLTPEPQEASAARLLCGTATPIAPSGVPERDRRAASLRE